MWLVLVKPSGWVRDKLFIRSSNALLSMLAISCRRIQSQASSLGYPSARPSLSFIHTVGFHSALISLVPYKLSAESLSNAFLHSLLSRSPARPRVGPLCCCLRLQRNSERVRFRMGTQAM